MTCTKCKNRILRCEFAAISCLLCGWIIYSDDLGTHAWYLQNRAFQCMKTYFALAEQMPAFSLRMRAA